MSTINDRLAALERQLQDLADAGERADAIRQFRDKNPDAAEYLIDRLAKLMRCDPPAAFEKVSGLTYDHALTWEENTARYQPPEGSIPTDEANALQEISQLVELVAAFRAIPANATLLDEAATKTGTTDLLQIVAHANGGAIGRALGAFCREHRYRFPGAKLIRVGHGRSVVMFSPEGTLLQLFAERPLGGAE